MFSYLGYAAGAFVISFVTQRLTMHLFRVFGFFADSTRKPQSVHTTHVARAGGIGIFTGLFFTVAEPTGINLLVAFGLALLSGIVEDFNASLSPVLRLMLQLVAALWAVLVTHAVVTYLGLGIYLPYSVGLLFSIVAIVGLMNAINFIDGMHGLASGIALLIFTAYAIVAYRTSDHIVLILSFTSIGSLLGFFVWNFPKGHIFMGDGGAYLTGFILALTGIYLAANHDNVSPWFILSTLIYPVWEVLFSVYRRLRRGTSPLYPDHDHLHSLIYRHVTQNNAATSLLICLGYAPFLFLPALFYPNHSWGNLLTAIIFLSIYTALYRYLFRLSR